MEWLKNQFAQAKSGDKTARKRLLILGVSVVVVLSLLISGQTKSEPIRIVPKTKTNEESVTASGFIHIAGAVAKPGVYPLTNGMRLFEAVALAGGFTKSADQESVNLARTLTDGEQIIVGKGGTTPKSDGLVHLNQATVADLDKLPGLGPTLAARIIDWREANHGFRSIDDLRKVGGIGDKLFAAIRKLVSL
jgi:competence protein ComEA